MNLGLVPYGRGARASASIAGAVSQGAVPETVIFLEHPPVVTIGRRTETDVELHIPESAAVEIAETDRGGKSTFHGPGQLVCYPILDLGNHGKDVKRYVRDLEEALIRTLAAFDLEAVRYEGLTGVWMPPSGGQGPRKIASIGVHVSRWVTTHGYALNVDLDPAPFTEWITACGLEDAQFTTMAQRARATDRRRGRAPRGDRRDRRGLRAPARRAPRRRRRRPLAAVDPRLARGPVTVDIRPIPRPGWDPLPYEGCVGVVGRVLVREDTYFVAELRFSEHATIHEHPGDNDTIVVCLEGEGYTSVAGETAALREGEQARWPRGIPHRLWTEDSTMTTLMVEHFD